MAKLLSMSICSAASGLLVSLGGCVVTTNMNGTKGTHVTVNGVTFTGNIGANSAKESFQKTFKAGTVSSIKTDNGAGSIEVNSTLNGPDEIHVVAVKTVHGGDSADKLKMLLPDVSVQAEQVDGALVLSSNHPADFDKRNIYVTVDYVVTVPSRLGFDLRTGSGSIAVNGVSGGGKLHSDFGAIYVKDASGNLDLSSKSGAISVRNALQATKIVADSGFGNIDLEHVGGSIDAGSSSGSVTLTDSRHAVTTVLNSNFGAITIRGAEGSISATSKSGTVSVSDSRVTGSMVLESGFGNVDANNITSATPELKVEMTAQSGAVTYHGEASDLSLRSGFGEVDGELGSALTLRAAKLQSSSGAVTLQLPAASSATVNASTTSGTVTLPAGSSGNSGLVTLGGGTAPVTLKSSFGNVTLRTK